MKLLVLLAICLSCTCAAAEDDAADAESINAAKQVVLDNLKDPDSAQFKNMVVAGSGNRRSVCGELNAKNGHGGYMGFRKFYSRDGSNTYVMKSGDKIMDPLVDMVCSRK